MQSFNLILDLCLLLLMIFLLLGQNILLFTATDIIRQCPCTSASIIFFTPLLTKLLTKLRTSRSFNFSSSSRALVRRTSHHQTSLYSGHDCMHSSPTPFLRNVLTLAACLFLPEAAYSFPACSVNSLRSQRLLSLERTNSNNHLRYVLQPPQALLLVCAYSVHFCLLLSLSEASHCSLPTAASIRGATSRSSCYSSSTK